MKCFDHNFDQFDQKGKIEPSLVKSLTNKNRDIYIGIIHRDNT